MLIRNMKPQKQEEPMNKIRFKFEKKVKYLRNMNCMFKIII